MSASTPSEQRPGLSARFDALVTGENAGPAVIGLAGILFAIYRLLDVVQGQLRASGSLAAPAVDVAAAQRDLLVSYGLGALGLVAYLVLAAAFARGRIEPNYQGAVLALAVGAHMGVLLTAPALSSDAFSYIGHGAIPLAVPGATPYSQPSTAILGTPLGDALGGAGWAPPPMLSPYGPIWTLIEMGLARFAPSMALGVVGVKVIAFLSAMGSAWLVWRILAMIRPRRRALGTVLYLWNPLIFVELPLEGHNDGLMALFTLLAIYLLLRARTGPAILAAAAGVLTKYVTAILVPAAAVYAWRTSGDRRKLMASTAVGGVGALALTIAAFAPLWNGLATFDGLMRSGAAGGYATLPGALYRLVGTALPSLDAALVAVLVPSLVFLAIAIFQASRVRDARTFLVSAAWTSVAYLLLARGLYYPWYGIIPISLLVLSPERRFVLMLVFVTAVGRLVAPLIDLSESAYLFPGMGFTLANLGTYATLIAFLYLWSRQATTWAEEVEAAPIEPDDAADLSVTAPTGAPAAAPTGAPGRGSFLSPEQRAALDRVVAVIRSDAGPRTLVERLLLIALVAVPMVATGIALLPEVFVRVPAMNDDLYHWLFIQNANDALSRGANILDHWLPQMETGSPQFLYYQHLPSLLVVALGRLTGGIVDLADIFNGVRWLLLTTFPLTVAWSMRRMGFSLVAAAFAGAASCLLAGGSLYGFDYDSYVWRGWGLYTQLFAMHLSFIVLATAYRAITTGRGIVVAAVAFAALVLAHLVYAYMMGITLLVVALVGMSRSNGGGRILRFGLVGSVGAAISAYMWLPFILQSAYLNATPYLQEYKYDSYGAPQVLAWLFGGQLFDWGRAPVLTGLVAVGIVAAIASRKRAALLAVVLGAVWLVLYFGRPTLGGLADLLPLSHGLLFHRFIGAVHLAGIVLIGVGGAAIWALVFASGNRNAPAMAALVLVLVLLPTLRERLDYYGFNGAAMERSAAAVANDADAQAILAKIETLPPGRVWAGMTQTYANDIKLEEIPFVNLFLDRGMVALPPPTASVTLTSDVIWEFDDSSRTSYELFDVRYVVAPASRAMADFLTPVMTAGRYALYEVRTSGYGEYVRIVDWSPVASQAELLARNRWWARTQLPADRVYAAFDYPSKAPMPTHGPVPGCADGGAVTETSVSADGYAFQASCDMDSAFVIKATYHPNWEVTVDGRPAETFMASPSYLGVRLPAGEHTVVATYRAHPLKAPLAIAGLTVLGVALLLRRRIEAIPDAVLRLVGRLRDAVAAQLEKERREAERERGATRGADGPDRGAEPTGADA